MTNILYLVRRMPSLRGKQLLNKYKVANQQVVIKPTSDFFVGWDGKCLLVESYPERNRIDEYDVVRLAARASEDKEFSYAASVWMKNHKVPVIGVQNFFNARSKIFQLIALTDEGVRYPKSAYCVSSKRLVELYRWSNERMGIQFPIIVKCTTGSQGQCNYFVKTIEELAKLQRKPNKFIMQEYIENDRDYRVLVLGGIPSMIMERKRNVNKTHLNNTSKGAVATLLPVSEVDPEIISLALKAAAVMKKSDLSGVDVVKSEKGVYILEVNSTPEINTGVSESVDIGFKLNAMFSHLDAIAIERTEN